MPNYTDKQRHLAMQRATRLGRLFNEKYFDAILTAIENKNEQAFRNACNVEDDLMTEAEIDWLWNYLQHSNDPPLVNGKGKWAHAHVREAGTGW